MLWTRRLVALAVGAAMTGACGATSSEPDAQSVATSAATGTPDPTHAPGTDDVDTDVAAADPTGPSIDDHWHHAYGFFLCDRWVELTGDAEERAADGSAANDAYVRTGVHSHDDGLIHWHPFTSASLGDRARLGVFLDVYDVDVSDSRLTLPDAQLDGAAGPENGVFDEDETTCSGERSELTALVWPDLTDPDAVDTVTTDIADVPLRSDAMAVAIVFAPPGTEVGLPPSTDDFADNVRNDQPGRGDGGACPIPGVADDDEPVATEVSSSCGVGATVTAP